MQPGPRGEPGKSQRQQLQFLAGNGNTHALALLDCGPDCPDELWHLYEWARDLVGMSGAGMSGALPLTWQTIAAWTAQTGEIVHPWEVRVLRRLDAVLRHPEVGGEEDDG